VLPTGVFEQFLDENDLHRFSPGARTMEEYGEILGEFARAPLPGRVRECLADWLAGVDFPLAARSSAFLEDSLHYSFAGKYHTVFIPNRGPLQVRLAAPRARPWRGRCAGGCQRLPLAQPPGDRVCWGRVSLGGWA
jgi:hypothetical protein